MLVRLVPCRRDAWLPRWAVIIMLAWAGLVALGYWISRGDSTIPTCNLRRLTGVPCPTCGGTRAAHSLVQGQIADATMLNPMVTVLLMLTAAALILRVGAGRRVQLTMSTWGTRLLWAACISIVVANWAYLIFRHR